MVVAGEVSGDMHAASLVRALRRRAPDLEVFGIGGDAMRGAGVDTIQDINAMAVTGITEVVRKLRALRRIFYRALALARSRHPDAVILVDYPGFNLRFAARAHALGLRTIYYICPQVWAWNRGRIPRMATRLDRLIAFFPFEKDCFAGTGLTVDIVGHPLIDETDAQLAAPEPDLPWQGNPRIALLPGSRDHEIARILPPVWSAAGRIEQRHPDASFLIPAPNEDTAQLVRRHIDALRGGPARWDVLVDQAPGILRTARAAIVASGTATLEACLLRCPMVITYKTSPLTALLARLLVRIDHFGIVNIVAGREICPELLQRAATPARLADTIEPLIADDGAHAAMCAELDGVRRALGSGGAVERAADAVLDALARPLRR